MSITMTVILFRKPDASVEQVGGYVEVSALAMKANPSSEKCKIGFWVNAQQEGVTTTNLQP